MELAKAYVQIVPSAKGVKGKLEQAIGGDVASAGSEAGASFGKNLVGTLTKVVAAAGIVSAIKSSLDAGGALQQSFGGLETIYGDAAESAKEYAKQAAKAGISMNDYAEQAVSFGASLKQSFGDDLQGAVDAANVAILDMADNSAKMGTPLENIQNAYQGFAKQNYTMLDNLKLGYGGTKKEMQRLLADAEKLSGVHYDIESLGDVYSAIHVIQQELGLTGVAAAEAEGTFTGSMQAMKASIENLKAAITTGGDLGESFEIVITSLSTFIFKNIAPMVGNILKSMPEIISSLFGGIVRLINVGAHEWFGSFEGGNPEIVELALKTILGIIQSIITGVPYLLESAFVVLPKAIIESLSKTDFSGVASAFLTDLKNDLDIMAGEIFGVDDTSGIIDAIITGIKTKLPFIIYAAGDVITSFVTGLLGKLPGVIDSATEIISSLIDGIFSAFPSVLAAAGETIITFVDGVLSKLPDIINSAAKMIDALSKGLSGNMPKVISAVLDIMKRLLLTIASHLPQIISAGMNLIASLAAGIIRRVPVVISAIGSLIKTIWETITNIDWFSLGVAIISGIGNGIKSMGSALGDAVKGIASNAFQEVKDFFGIASPSKLMEKEVGRWIPAGIAVGIEDNLGAVDDAMQEVASQATMSFGVGDTAAASGAINYGGVTINVTADDVQKSRDFVDWLEGQLVARQNSRRAAALA